MIYLLHHTLEKSAKKFPDKIAVVFKDESITYHDLNIRSNKLAHLLIKNGVKKGDRVGLYINKSIEAIIAIFGILKSGAAYVPLDINVPMARIDYIINNCQIQCLIGSGDKISNLFKILDNNTSLNMLITLDGKPEFNKLSSIEFFSNEEVEKVRKTTNPETSTIWTDLAYLLYTSGSTGQPKGVMISHLNALNFVNWVSDIVAATSDDIFSNHAPFHFDLSILDIYVAFLVSGKVYPVPEEYSYFPFRLAEWINDNKISIWYSVPSILSMMVVNGKLEKFKFKNLRVIFFAGEVFPVKYLRQLMQLIPHPDFYNLFGPTETNVITYYKVPDIPENQIKPIPIGKVCKNMEIILVDNEGNKISEVGVKGEIYARGSNVAQGYWGDPDKTEKTFINNNQNVYLADEMYKTGDLAMLDEYGNYIFFGRKDHMIKSRGYRIELGEIETVLYTHPDIKEAAVIAVPDEKISNRLKAFIAMKDGKSVSENEIQKHCAKKIPKYMVPEEIEFRASLPKNPHGKIDRTKLAD